eukprot:scaffold16686_cov97-Isochrysis_galbana.AAC.7
MPFTPIPFTPGRAADQGSDALASSPARRRAAQAQRGSTRSRPEEGGPAFCFWRGAARRFVFGAPRQGRPVRGEAARLPRRRLSPRMRTGTKGDRAAGSTPPTWYHCIMWHQTDVFEPVCLSRPRVIKLLKRTTVSNESMTPPSARVRMDGPLPTSTTRPSPAGGRGAACSAERWTEGRAAAEPPEGESAPGEHGEPSQTDLSGEAGLGVRPGRRAPGCRRVGRAWHRRWPAHRRTPQQEKDEQGAKDDPGEVRVVGQRAEDLRPPAVRVNHAVEPGGSTRGAVQRSAGGSVPRTRHIGR